MSKEYQVLRNKPKRPKKKIKKLEWSRLRRAHTKKMCKYRKWDGKWTCREAKKKPIEPTKYTSRTEIKWSLFLTHTIQTTIWDEIVSLFECSFCLSKQHRWHFPCFFNETKNVSPRAILPDDKWSHTRRRSGVGFSCQNMNE